MVKSNQMEDRSQQAMQEQAQTELRAIFEKIPKEIPLFLFTSPGKNVPFCQAARQVIHAVKEMAPKITLLEYDLSHEIARKWSAQYSPTLLFDPEH